ncbi:MAG: hypothetical protein J7M08_08825, partial [Planctomycetes bacterium]|nr:hypothetical protein [Planctomycetota bacterium]
GGRLALLPLLNLLWVNLHAGFLSGFLLLGAFGVGEMMRYARRREGRLWTRLASGPTGARFRAMLFAGCACLVVSVVTPNGAGALMYPFRLMLEVHLLSRICEWQPMPLSGNFMLFWAVLGIGAVAMLRSFLLSRRAGRLRREANVFVTDGLLFFGFALLAIKSCRHVAWVMLLTPSIFGYHLVAARSYLSDKASARPLYAWVAALLALVVGVLPVSQRQCSWLKPPRRQLPVNAAAFIESNGLDLRFYNTYEWGGYLIWRFWPARKVFIDGRCLVYGDDLIRQALKVEDGAEGWQEVLRRWKVKMLILRYGKRPAAHIFADDRWRCVYWDDTVLVALRDDVYEERRPGLPELKLSNPALRPDRFENVDIAALMEELDIVLARTPECGGALAARARCLVRLAPERPEDSRGMLQDALKAARQAVKLFPASALSWRALSEAASATGDDKLAASAAAKAARLKENQQY